jgi:hypothetical protein
MIPSLPINEHCQTYSCWLAARTAKLAFIRSIRRPLHSQTPRTAHSAFIRTNSLTLTALQNHLCTRHFLSLPLPLACPNPHSLFAGPSTHRKRMRIAQ